MTPPNNKTANKKHNINSEGNINTIATGHMNANVNRSNMNHANMNTNSSNINSIPALKPSNSSSSDQHSSFSPQQQHQQYSLSPTSMSYDTNTFQDEHEHEHEHEHEQDLNLFVSDLLDQMTSKFEHMGKSILSRIDDMGDRIDTLEQSITDLLDVQGVERFDQHSHFDSHSHSHLGSHSQPRMRHMPGLNMNQTTARATNDE